MTKVRDLDHLLDVAARLFGEQGYEGTRLEDIADELGVLKGSLYYYTTSKFELLQKVNARRLRRLLDQAVVISHSETPADERLEHIIRAHLATIDEFYPESSQWFVETFVKRGESEPLPHDSMHHQYARLLTDLVRSGQESDIFRRDVDPHMAAHTVLGAANWLTFWYTKGGRLTIEEISDQIVAMLLDGIRATPGVTSKPARHAVAAAIGTRRP